MRGCARAAYAKGMCRLHYARAWRGVPLTVERRDKRRGKAWREMDRLTVENELARLKELYERASGLPARLRFRRLIEELIEDVRHSGHRLSG